jgi:predicted solute-binding protein
MLHGPQKGAFDLSFSVPSECADRVAAGEADIGIVPCAELPRLGLSALLDTGIACRGPVRSILLISKVAPERIRTLAADTSSRTSVMLSRIILAQRFGCYPQIAPRRPELDRMLETADAALIIGDPALRLDPASLPYRVLDLGEEWLGLTGLPMVFAVWAGAEEAITEEAARVFVDSCQYGLAHLEDIVSEAHQERGFPKDLARTYLTRHIVCELGEMERRGLDRFLAMAAELYPVAHC